VAVMQQRCGCMAGVVACTAVVLLPVAVAAQRLLHWGNLARRGGWGVSRGTRPRGVCCGCVLVLCGGVLGWHLGTMLKSRGAHQRARGTTLLPLKCARRCVPRCRHILVAVCCLQIPLDTQQQLNTHLASAPAVSASQTQCSGG
jgi:hypothetical protein